MTQSTDRVVTGVLLMMGFSFVAPVMDAFAKLASDQIPVGQIVAWRFGLQALILIPIAFAVGNVTLPDRRTALLHILRAAMLLLATLCFFQSLAFLPMADAIAIFFVEPFILTLLGGLFLREQVGWRRITACAVGFGGAMLVIRPSFSAFGPVAMLPLGTALFFALYMLVTRMIAGKSHPVIVQMWTALAATALVVPLLLIFNNKGFQPLDSVWPTGHFWAYLAGVGVVATISHLFLSASLRFAPAATIAPLQYLEIVAASALGYFLFDDLPDLQTLLGIAIIMGSGLYVFVRERRMNRPVPPAP